MGRKYLKGSWGEIRENWRVEFDFSVLETAKLFMNIVMNI
jgi:hypothetical protein